MLNHSFKGLSPWSILLSTMWQGSKLSVAEKSWSLHGSQEAERERESEKQRQDPIIPLKATPSVAFFSHCLPKLSPISFTSRLQFPFSPLHPVLCQHLPSATAPLHCIHFFSFVSLQNSLSFLWISASHGISRSTELRHPFSH